MSLTLEQRAKGALWGMACGDAFGMPNFFLHELHWRTGKEARPSDSPYHTGYRAGRVTDDTEQALKLTKALVNGFSREAVARNLLDWFIAVGGREPLAVGPSTRQISTRSLSPFRNSSAG